MYRDIPSKLISSFKRSFNQITKRAFDAGIEEPAYEITYTENRPVMKTEHFGEVYEEYNHVEFSPLNITLGAWKLVAMIQIPQGEIKQQYTNVLKNNALYRFYEDVPEEVTNKSPYLCECSNTTTRRSLYFILKHTETGEYKQVASSYLYELTEDKRAKSVPSVLNGLDLVENYEIANTETVDPVYIYKTEKVLPIAVYVFNKYGWISSRKAETSDILSSSDIIKVILANDRLPKDYNAEECEREAQDVREYHATRIETIKGKENVENVNEFYGSLSEHTTAAYTDDKLGSIGILCYAVSVYHDHISGIETKDDSIGTRSEYVGTLNKHIEVTAKLLYKNERMSRYGRSIIAIFDQNGNKIKIFSGLATRIGTMIYNANIDEMFVMKGVVSEQSEFNFIKYTTLKHVQVCKVLPPQEQNIAYVRSEEEIYA